MGQAIIVFGDDAEIVDTMINAPTEKEAAKIKAKVEKLLNPAGPETKEE